MPSSTTVAVPAVPHHRRSIRLPGYDYSSVAAYFVTICVRDRQRVLSTIRRREVVLTGFGACVHEAWSALPARHRHVVLDAFVIMPDHFHGILVLTAGPWGDEGALPRRHGLGTIVGGFKSHTARAINLARGTSGQPFWHRNYFERIIRDPWHMRATRKYIARNPARWRHGEA